LDGDISLIPSPIVAGDSIGDGGLGQANQGVAGRSTLGECTGDHQEQDRCGEYDVFHVDHLTPEKNRFHLLSVNPTKNSLKQAPQPMAR